MSPEQLAIAGLFAVLQGFATVVITTLWNENKELRRQLNDSNKTSRDLIQAVVTWFERNGIQVVPTDRDSP